MRTLPLAAALACSAAVTLPALAHGIAGDRVFPATLTIDDPAVGDELSLPTFTYQPEGASADGPASRSDAYELEWDKTILPQLGFALNDGWSITRPSGQGSRHGWDDLDLTLKYEFYENSPHEILMSAGIVRELGGTGTVQAGAATVSSTAPTFYLGKGMGDLPDSMGLLRPFALTGEVAYQVADEQSQTTTIGRSLHYAENPDSWNLGFSVQYNLRYLAAQVKDYGLPDFFNRLIPLVEFSYSTPATRPYGQTTTGTIAPGLLYEGQSFQIGVEALVPATRASGNAVGVLAQLHFYLDDLLPNSLGKPLFGG